MDFIQFAFHLIIWVSKCLEVKCETPFRYTTFWIAAWFRFCLTFLAKSLIAFMTMKTDTSLPETAVFKCQPKPFLHFESAVTNFYRLYFDFQGPLVPQFLAYTFPPELMIFHQIFLISDYLCLCWHLNGVACTLTGYVPGWVVITEKDITLWSPYPPRLAIFFFETNLSKGMYLFLPNEMEFSLVF